MKLIKLIKTAVTSTYALILIFITIIFLLLEYVHIGQFKDILTIILFILFFSSLILEAISDLSKKHFVPTFYIIFVDIIAILSFLIAIYFNYVNPQKIYTFLVSIIVLKISRHGDMIKINKDKNINLD
ncbi:MAG: hypothetical protein K0S18_964 [Anaerocolumna sp.]|nr:hypothetical protein [Anaerocolumna sp.]